jgi:hypothetical protein
MRWSRPQNQRQACVLGPDPLQIALAVEHGHSTPRTERTAPGMLHDSIRNVPALMTSQAWISPDAVVRCDLKGSREPFSGQFASR